VPGDCHENIRRAVEYWLSIHPPEGLPGRQHLDPADVPELLPYLHLIDFAGDPPKFKIRLMGTASVNFFEKDFTGRWYHDAFPEFTGSAAEELFAKTVQAGAGGHPHVFNRKIIARPNGPCCRLQRTAATRTCSSWCISATDWPRKRT
jgi:hypothetical protein